MADKTQLPVLHREAQVVAGSLDEKERTFDIVWTAGAEVPRIDWWTGQRYVEVLEVSAKAIRLDKRFQSGNAPILDSHQRWTLVNQLGNVVKNSVRVADGKATLKARMSNRPEIAGIVGDIRDGIISNVSPGYITHAYREELRDGVTYRIATDWEPIELSFVPVGADPDAGLARSLVEGHLRDPGGHDVTMFPCTVMRAETTGIGAAAAAKRRMELLAREYRL